MTRPDPNEALGNPSRKGTYRRTSDDSRFAEGKPDKVRVAPGHYRVLAGGLDLLLTVLAVKTLLIPLSVPSGWDLSDREPSPFVVLGVYLLGFLLFVCKDAFGGKSPGKRMFRLRVCLVQESHPRPRLRQSIARNLFWVALPVEIVLLLVEKYHRRWGDKFSGTMVVQKLEPFAVRSLSVRVVAVLLAFSLFWSAHQLTTPILIGKTDSFRFAVDYLDADPALVEALGEGFERDFWFDFSIDGEILTFKFRLTNRDRAIDCSISLLRKDGGYVFHEKKIAEVEN